MEFTRIAYLDPLLKGSWWTEIRMYADGIIKKSIVWRRFLLRNIGLFGTSLCDLSSHSKYLEIVSFYFRRGPWREMSIRTIYSNSQMKSLRSQILFPFPGDQLATWTEDSLMNPEEMGEYAEGDILMPQSLTRNGIKEQTLKWPNGHIPYVIEGSFSKIFK